MKPVYFKHQHTLICLFVCLCSLFGTAPIAKAEGFTAPCGQTLCTVYKVDLSKDRLELFDRDQAGERFKNADGLLKRISNQDRSLRFATNAGIFDPNYDPVGLMIRDGQQQIPLNISRGAGNFYMEPNGVFYVSAERAQIVETMKYTSNKGVRIASQSGPLLVIGGVINSQFSPGSKNKTIRSGVGVRAPGKDVYFVISNDSINLYDFANFFREHLGCYDALYLDGYISKMYLPELGRKEVDGDFAAMFAVYK